MSGEHPAENPGAHGVTRRGARTRREDERDDAEHEGKRGHQNRTEAKARRFDGGRKGTFAFFELLRGDFHDQNRVLRGETHEHHEADLEVNVVRRPRAP